MTSYNGELRFFQGLLNQLKIPYLITNLTQDFYSVIDLGLRSALGIDSIAQRERDSMVRKTVRENNIYYLNDEFSCRYISFILPETDGQKTFTIGPYVTENINRLWLEKFQQENGIDLDWMPVLENHYRRVLYMPDDSFLVAAVNAFGERIWGVHKFTSERIQMGLPEKCMPLTEHINREAREEILSGIRRIEESYAAENRLMQAVAQGRSHRVRTMFSHLQQSLLEPRVEPVRNARNYSIILNTLLRKAAEQGGVHPLYIDQLSSEYAAKIEQTNRWEDFTHLWGEMAHKYCLLVEKHSMCEYSPLVQKVISRVDFDLTADLSLKSHAEALSVNASYLSSLFKKETGQTVTDFVGRKRIEHAVYLLSSTQQPISVVAQQCGISDDNYFTKMFKKYTNLTPKQFRQESNRLRKK